MFSIKHHANSFKIEGENVADRTPDTLKVHVGGFEHRGRRVWTLTVVWTDRAVAIIDIRFKCNVWFQKLINTDKKIT
jgi:hypothetical protein